MTIGSPSCRCGAPSELHFCADCAERVAHTVMDWDRAAVCAECQGIYPLPATSCPRCGSEHAITLSRTKLGAEPTPAERVPERPLPALPAEVAP